MKRRVFSGIICILLLISMLTLAFNIQQTESLEPPATEWSKTYGGTNSDTGCSLVQTSDGGYAIAANTYSFGSGWTDAWLIKTDSSGNMQWNQVYGGTGIDRAHSLVQTTDGGYAIAGWTESFGWLSGVYVMWRRKKPTAGTREHLQRLQGMYDRGEISKETYLKLRSELERKEEEN